VAETISVVVPAYNNAAHLSEALRSILGQSRTPTEIIVVDDASTDGTAEALKPFAGQVKVIRLDKNSGGPARPRNTGLRVATGDFLALFDADDRMLPESLALRAAFLAAHPDIPFVFGNFRNFTGAGPQAGFLDDHTDFQAMAKEPLGDNRYRLRAADAFETLIGDNFIGTPGVMFRRSLLDAVGFFDETLTHCDDIEFWTRVARRFNLGYVDALLFERRLHPGNLSSTAAAHHDKIRFRLRLKKEALSPRAQKTLDDYLAKTFFSIGYDERRQGRRLSAVNHYLKSWSYAPARLSVFKAIARALMPF